MDTVMQIFHDGQFVPYFVLGGGFLIAIIGIVAGTVSGIVGTRAREASRRELAAYVAEGSISPADAERLMHAEPKNAGCC